MRNRLAVPAVSRTSRTKARQKEQTNYLPQASAHIHADVFLQATFFVEFNCTLSPVLKGSSLLPPLALTTNAENIKEVGRSLNCLQSLALNGQLVGHARRRLISAMLASTCDLLRATTYDAEQSRMLLNGYPRAVRSLLLIPNVTPSEGHTKDTWRKYILRATFGFRLFTPEKANWQVSFTSLEQ